MTRINCQEQLCGLLIDQGIEHLSNYMTLNQDSEGYDGKPPRAEIAIGYYDKNRFKIMTSANVPSLNEAVTMIRDREKLATMLELATGFMPEAVRPELPGWVISKSTANDVLNQMRRASRSAKKAALVSSGKITAANEDRVF